MPYLLAFSGHLLADRMWSFSQTLLWPLRGRRFHHWKHVGSPQAIVRAYAKVIRDEPLLLTFEALGALLLAWFILDRGLWQRENLAAFAKTGTFRVIAVRNINRCTNSPFTNSPFISHARNRRHGQRPSITSVPGDSTRPIADRVKSALFSILESQEFIRDHRWLDLFGGTGAVGIEALSRGAASVVFVEKDGRAVQVLGQNLRSTGLGEGGRSHVVRGDAFAYLARPEIEPFDLIYIAPPQYKSLWQKALLAVDARPELLTERGQVVVQIFPKEDDPALPLLHLRRYDERQYGSTRLDLLRTVSAPPSAAAPPVFARARIQNRAAVTDGHANGSVCGAAQGLARGAGPATGRGRPHSSFDTGRAGAGPHT